MNNLITPLMVDGEMWVKATEYHKAVGAAFEAGKNAAFAQAAHTIGIDTCDGMHTVTVFRMLPGHPTTLVATARLPDERASMMQLFTDPENQPTQHGTVTVEYMQREIAAERERLVSECIDLVAFHGGPVDLEAAIRARGQA